MSVQISVRFSVVVLYCYFVNCNACVRVEDLKTMTHTLHFPSFEDLKSQVPFAHQKAEIKKFVGSRTTKL